MTDVDTRTASSSPSRIDSEHGDSTTLMPESILPHEDSRKIEQVDRSDSPEMVGSVESQSVATDSIVVSPARLVGLKTWNGLAVSFIMSFFTNVVLFALGVLLVLAMDKIGILSTVNGLMGSMMKFEVKNLIMLLMLFNVILTFFMTGMGFLSTILFNAASALVGGLKLKIILDRPSVSKTRRKARKIEGRSSTDGGEN